MLVAPVAASRTDLWPNERLSDVLAASAAKRPAKVALRMRHGGVFQEITYEEFLSRARRGAERLAALGLERGDRVGLFSENSAEWLPAYFAIVERGLTAVPIDRQLKEADVRYILETSEARALIASAGALETLTEPYRLALRVGGVPVLDIGNALSPVADSAAACRARFPGSPDDGDPDLASIIFTSGTTGRPKGVMLTHRNFIFDARAALEATPFEATDELLSVLPLHHVFQFMMELGLIMRGGTVTYVEAVRGDLILEAMRETGTTILPAVPRLLDLFLSGIKRKVAESGKVGQVGFAALSAIAGTSRLVGVDLSRRLFGRVHEGFGGRLRFIISGAAALPAETYNDLERLGFRIIEGYGLTETAPIVTVNRVESRKPGSVGPPIPGVEVRIVHPDSRGVGEIAVRGPNVMRGYFRDPEATAAVVRDGWFYTGDLGRLDRDGHLAITGRVKDLIVTSAGKNVSPLEVETHYRNVAGIKEICAFGARGASLGEEVHAAAVLDPEAFPAGMTAEERQRAAEECLAAHAEQAGIPSYMRIQRVHVLDDLPKTTTLKVKRYEVRATVGKLHPAGSTSGQFRALGKSASSADRVVAAVREFAGERARTVTLDATLQFDLGLDSLERVELLSELERRFGARFPEDVAARIHRVRDVVEAVLRYGGEAPPGASSGVRDQAAAFAIPSPRGLAATAALREFGFLARALYGLRAEGLENVPQGPAIFCPNHESHLDVFFVSSLLPEAVRRDLICFAKREHFEATGTRLFATLARAIPVDRDGDVRPALRVAAAALRAGRPLLIHPEGTRTKTGALGPFRAGAALLAVEHNVPLVPVKIRGAFEIFPESRLLPRLADWRSLRRLKIEIRFGKPLTPDPAPGGDLKESADLLTLKLREAVASL